jgi:N-acetylglutamate synthase-like GNAT family acetyltransferase
MSLRFRQADHDDVPELVALVESAYRGERSRQGWTTEADLIDGQRVDTRMLTDSLADPDTTVLVRLDDQGDAIACCELRRVDERTAAFGMFAVSPMLHGDGLGGEVLAEAERVAAQEWGATQLRMSVITLRAELIEWYGRRGYTPTGEEQAFPYGDERFGRPRRDDLRFTVLAKELSGEPESGRSTGS